jgi:uncharacterized protein YdeI (BOF family)
MKNNVLFHNTFIDSGVWQGSDIQQKQNVHIGNKIKSNNNNSITNINSIKTN